MENQKVLVLDDDPIIGLSCKKILDPDGYIVSSVTQGGDAIRLISNEEFDLLIADIRLPDMNGVEVLREAKAIQPTMDIIIITGYPTMEDAKEAIRLGAFEYLEKPFTPDFMRNVVKRVFDKRGWILRKTFIDQFKEYITPLSELDEKTIYYKEGIWARPLKGALWEIGLDVRRWFLTGQLLYIDVVETPAVSAGKTFAHLVSEDGRIRDLYSPMSGSVKERNVKANDAVYSLVRDCLSENWLMWLVRILPKTSHLKRI
ncbi:MAG TPA: response regulator [Thermodesulfovibrionales bacterium]|nr:response regulator [Thermodesulfovibrionales bacterium]